MIQLERYAATYLDKTIFDYFLTGGDGDVTLHENRQAFKRYKYYPAGKFHNIGLLTLTLTRKYSNLTYNCLPNPKLALRYLANPKILNTKSP